MPCSSDINITLVNIKKRANMMNAKFKCIKANV